MPNRKQLEQGIEVNGICVDVFVEAFKLFPSVVLKRLPAFGIGTIKGKDVVIDKEAWYPLENWLAAYEDIINSIGPRATHQMGMQIPKVAPPPPQVNDIHQIAGAVDVIYHTHHRKNGRPMFNPANGSKLDGIGNYGYKPTPGEKKITSICDNPYPCEFDRGLITAYCQTVEKYARVTHDDRAPCRKRGEPACTYTIVW